jgi:hypothetical protein
MQLSDITVTWFEFWLVAMAWFLTIASSVAIISGTVYGIYSIIKKLKAM